MEDEGGGSSPGAARPSSLDKRPRHPSVSSPSSHQSTRTSENGSGAGGGADHVRVVVRVRPLFADEVARGEQLALHAQEDGRSLLVVEPGVGGHTMTRSFQFDACLGPSTRQQAVMAKCGVQRLLDAALNGFSATLLAYGQTGSGKTFTMSGREEAIEGAEYHGDQDDGLITRSVAYLFEAIRKRHSDGGQPLIIRASYLEIYNEQVYDLLREQPSQRVEVKWSINDGFYVEGLLLVECESIEDVFSVISEGARNRKVGSHALNKDSSRSHSMMSIHLETPEAAEGGTAKYGKVTFVDLAGSERLKLSKSEGGMAKETGSINRSLFALGKVISALGEGKQKKEVYVPYRDSKLTKLLMDSLGGTALALMVACCSPTLAAVEETLSTLHYATRAKNIQNTPTLNVDERDKAMAGLQREIALLREENAVLRQQLGLPSAGDVISALTRRGSSSDGREALDFTTSAAHLRGGREDGLYFPAITGHRRGGSDPSSPPGYAAAGDLRGLAKEELARRLQDAQVTVRGQAEERERLWAELRALRSGRQEVEAAQRSLQSENQRLQAKLAHLEAVFVGREESSEAAEASPLHGMPPLGRSGPSSSGQRRGGGYAALARAPLPATTMSAAPLRARGRGGPLEVGGGGSHKGVVPRRSQGKEQLERESRAPKAIGSVLVVRGSDPGADEGRAEPLSPDLGGTGVVTNGGSSWRQRRLSNGEERSMSPGAFSVGGPVPKPRAGSFLSPRKEVAELFQLRQANAKLLKTNEQLMVRAREYERQLAGGLAGFDCELSSSSHCSSAVGHWSSNKRTQSSGSP